MLARRIIFAALPLLSASAARSETPIPVTNLELASEAFHVSGDRIVFSVLELAQGGQDLNRDGDSRDEVLHTYNLASRTMNTLEISGGLGFESGGSGDDGRPPVFGDWLVFSVSELGQGEDLNEDGDAGDMVLHVFEIPTRKTTNLKLAGDGFVWQNWVVFQVHESSQGGRDLNGDGDANDKVLHVYDLSHAMVRNLGLAITEGLARLSGNRLVFSVSESGQGGVDLNGDEDTSDGVVHVHDLGLHSTTNLGVAADGRDLRISRNWLVFLLDEAGQGGVDLNNDGDAVDLVIHVHDFETDLTANLEAAVRRDDLYVAGRWLVFLLDEAQQGESHLNADGDVEDRVIHLHDLLSAKTTNLGFASGRTALSASWLAFAVLEWAHGLLDLDGDGDANDPVLHLHDFEHETTTSLELPSERFALSEHWLAFTVSEPRYGGTDLNFDGDAEDAVLHVRHLGSGMTTNLGLAADDLALSGSWLVFSVSEEDQEGESLNGDADSDDAVLHFADLRQLLPPRPFRRGDADGTNGIQLTDAVLVLNFLFGGMSAPPCLDAADASDDGTLNITSAVYVLSWLFLGGPPPPPPGPNACGEDPTLDDLDCASYDGCA